LTQDAPTDYLQETIAYKKAVHNIFTITPLNSENSVGLFPAIRSYGLQTTHQAHLDIAIDNTSRTLIHL
jgi:hypothetical protein